MSVNYYAAKDAPQEKFETKEGVFGNHPERHALSTEERLAAYLDFARSSKTKPPTKDLWKAVSKRDLESAAAWVVAGEKPSARLAEMFGRRSAARSEALGFAAAIGWADGVKLLLGPPSIDDVLLWDARPLQGTFSEEKAEWSWRPERYGEHAQNEQFEGNNMWAAGRRCYTALAFAVVNKNTESAKALIEHYREKNNDLAALPVWMLCRPTQNHRLATDPAPFRKQSTGFKGEGNIGVHHVEDSIHCGNNAAIFAMQELPMEMARALVLAGGGSAELADEFWWAAQQGRTAEARMLLSASPQSAALRGKIGKALVEMAVKKGDAELAKSLALHGVDISCLFIHSLKLEKALGMSHGECSDYLKQNGWTLNEQDRGSLMAFAENAQARERTLEARGALESAHGQQEERAGWPELCGRVEGPSDGGLGENALGANKAGRDAASDDKQRRVDAAVRELEDFGEIVAQMGRRIKDIIAELKDDGTGQALEEAPAIAEAKVAAMRERAAEARQAIAKAGSASRRGR